MTDPAALTALEQAAQTDGDRDERHSAAFAVEVIQAHHRIPDRRGGLRTGAEVSFDKSAIRGKAPNEFLSRTADDGYPLRRVDVVVSGGSEVRGDCGQLVVREQTQTVDPAADARAVAASSASVGLIKLDSAAQQLEVRRAEG